jgi:hypothetical protein
MTHRLLLSTLLAALALTASAQAQPVAAPDCTADVDLSSAGGLKVGVVYRCRADGPVTFRAPNAKGVASVLAFTDASGKPVAPSDRGWTVAPVNNLVEAHYKVDLLGYARAVDDPTMAIARGEGVYTLLEGWLFEPRGYENAPMIDIRIVHADPGLSFATGLPKVGDAWRLLGPPLRFAGYSAVGKFTLKDIAVPMPGSLRPGQPKRDGVLRLAIFDGFSAGGPADLTDWVQRTAEAESNYWKGFTAPELLLGLLPMPGQRGVGFGRTVPGGGASIMVEVGPEIDRRSLFGEWVLVHELIHTGMPFIDGRGTWLMEGAATFVEPVIRARAGWKTEAEAWKEWIDNMPRGAPAFANGLAYAAGNQNYWSGATFMLMADIGIRRATGGAKGLEDCLGGVLWSGVDARERASIPEFAVACDHATGSTVFSTLVDQHFSRPNPVDLPQLWKDLGVAEVAGRIVFDDTAPLAQWRKMVVMGAPGHPTPTVKLPFPS